MNLSLNQVFPVFPIIYKRILHVNVSYTTFSFQSVCAPFVGRAAQTTAAGQRLLRASRKCYIHFLQEILPSLAGVQAKS